jgi:hypothetical protein
MSVVTKSLNNFSACSPQPRTPAAAPLPSVIVPSIVSNVDFCPLSSSHTHTVKIKTFPPHQAIFRLFLLPPLLLFASPWAFSMPLHTHILPRILIGWWGATKSATSRMIYLAAIAWRIWQLSLRGWDNSCMHHTRKTAILNIGKILPLAGNWIESVRGLIHLLAFLPSHTDTEREHSLVKQNVINLRKLKIWFRKLFLL